MKWNRLDSKCLVPWITVFPLLTSFYNQPQIHHSDIDQQTAIIESQRMSLQRGWYHAKPAHILITCCVYRHPMVRRDWDEHILVLAIKWRSRSYFWSCALGSCAIILQPLFIILVNSDVRRDAVPSKTMIYLTWLIMVVPQSWVLYSRLYLLLRTTKALSVIKYVIISNSIVFSVPNIMNGTIVVSAP